MSISATSVLSLWLYFGVEAPESVTVEQLFEESYAVARRLKSVDMVFSFEQPGDGPRAMRLRLRDGKLRGDGFFGHYVPNVGGDVVHVFDGKTLLAYASKEKQLGKMEHPTESVVLPFGDPLCETYLWLMTPPMISSLQVRSHARWLERATRAELQSPTVVKDVTCQRIRISDPGGTWVILDIADRLRIPLKWTEFDPKGLAQNEVTIQEWKEAPSVDGPVVLPTVVDSTSRLWLADGKIHENHYTYVVDLASVRINDQIGEDVFSIPMANVSELYDHGTQEVLNPATGAIRRLKDEETLNPRRVPPASVARTWIIVLNALGLLIAAAGVWLYVRRRSR